MRRQKVTEIFPTFRHAPIIHRAKFSDLPQSASDPKNLGPSKLEFRFMVRPSAKARTAGAGCRAQATEGSETVVGMIH
ncbi:hypothetical protein [Massilia timonae]|uniref:hypothetical protein n=1 Tax=Massilia timonae TaxID=47229 RepID=UPI002354D50C|nr:hypothetical protein [Massilia timonae]